MDLSQRKRGLTHLWEGLWPFTGLMIPVKEKQPKGVEPLEGGNPPFRFPPLQLGSGFPESRRESIETFEGTMRGKRRRGEARRDARRATALRFIGRPLVVVRPPLRSTSFVGSKASCKSFRKALWSARARRFDKERPSGPMRELNREGPRRLVGAIKIA